MRFQPYIDTSLPLSPDSTASMDQEQALASLVDGEDITVFLHELLEPDETTKATIAAMFGVGPLGEDIELTDDENELATAGIIRTPQHTDPATAEMFGIGPSGEDLELTDDEDLSYDLVDGEFRGSLPRSGHEADQ